jgi:hypothetical protein
MNYHPVQPDISSEITVDVHGFGSITPAGICALLGISRKNGLRSAHLDTVLSNLGFTFQDLDEGIPDLLVPYILDVYATTETSCRAKVLLSAFCTLGVRAWFKAVKENPQDAVRLMNQVLSLHTHFSHKLASK